MVTPHHYGEGDRHVLECPNLGLLWSQLKAALLYVIGNLGLNTLVDAVYVAQQVLQGELLSLLDLLSESLVVRDDSDVL